jgi:integrase
MDRVDDYVSPFAKVKRRVPKEARKRTKALTDDEIRAIWRTAETAGAYGALVRLLLLTAQRREKVISMRRADISPDGAWTVPSAAREKGTGGKLKLPDAALGIINALPRFVGDDRVFPATHGSGPFSNLSREKATFDQRCGVTGWVLHDLRAAARSLMSRAGVRPDIAERVLGHAVAGVVGVYDRHAYLDEKADALQRLAKLIEHIVNGGDGANVVAFPGAAS